MNSPDLTTLADLLERLLGYVGADTPLTISYHPDADPGDGSGWCVEAGDMTTFGTAAEALRSAVGVPHA